MWSSLSRWVRRNVYIDSHAVRRARRTSRPQHDASYLRRLRLEQLENRLVLTVPAPVFLSAAIVSQDQLHSQGPQTITSFVGYPDSVPGASGSFNLPLNLGDEGSSFPDTGIAVNVGLSGIKFGFSSTVTTSSGDVSGVYNPVLTQNYAEPTMLVQPVTFSPSNTNVTYNGSNFATTTPYTSFDLAAVAQATVNYSAAASFLGEEVGTSGSRLVQRLV